MLIFEPRDPNIRPITPIMPASDDSYTIELDCAPGVTRPDDIIHGILAGTGLSVEDDLTLVSKRYGEWVWRVKDVVKLTTTPADDGTVRCRLVPTTVLYANNQGEIAERIKRLHIAGTIRYGSW